MEVRITATYSATDGRMPESVEVVCEGVGVDQARSLMAPVLDMLLMAPTARYLSSADVPRMAEAARAAAQSLAEPRAERCQRVTCGHLRTGHRMRVEPDMLIGERGACEVCDNPDKCRSFVGKSGEKQ